jgi:hypothetical protein
MWIHCDDDKNVMGINLSARENPNLIGKIEDYRKVFKYLPLDHLIFLLLI